MEVRRRVAALERVSALDGCDVEGLVHRRRRGACACVRDRRGGRRSSARRRSRRRRERTRVARHGVARRGRLAAAAREPGEGRRRLRQPLLSPPPARSPTGRRSSSTRAARHAARRAGPGRGRSLDGDAGRLVRRSSRRRRGGLPRLRPQPAASRTSTPRSATPSRCRRSSLHKFPPNLRRHYERARAHARRGSPSSATRSAASTRSTARA